MLLATVYILSMAWIAATRVSTTLRFIPFRRSVVAPRGGRLLDRADTEVLTSRQDALE
jgi:hypothetical protein